MRSLNILSYAKRLRKNGEKCHHFLGCNGGHNNIAIVRCLAETGQGKALHMEEWELWDHLSGRSVYHMSVTATLTAGAVFHSANGKASLKIQQKLAHLARDDPSPSWNGGWTSHPPQVREWIVVFHRAHCSCTPHTCPPRHAMKLHRGICACYEAVLICTSVKRHANSCYTAITNPLKKVHHGFIPQNC